MQTTICDICGCTTLSGKSEQEYILYKKVTPKIGDSISRSQDRLMPLDLCYGCYTKLLNLADPHKKCESQTGYYNPVEVIHCEQCGYYNLRSLTCNRPFESMTNRCPDDYCSLAQRRNE